AADDGAEADDGVVAMLAGQFAGDDGHLPGAGDLDDVDQVGVGPGAGERIHGPVVEALGDEAIEPADNDGEPETGSVELPFKYSCHISLPGEGGGALLEECAGAFAAIFTCGGDAEGGCFETQAGFEPYIQTHVDG